MNLQLVLLMLSFHFTVNLKFYQNMVPKQTKFKCTTIVTPKTANILNSKSVFIILFANKTGIIILIIKYIFILPEQS